jgi:two-component system, LytTR family, response regulator LytT
MNLLILEDELIANQHLIDLLARYWPDARVLATLRSIGEARTWFASTHTPPDLIFSDIELLDGNVFALYEGVAEQPFRVPCPIIFTTAYDQFLLRAFQTNGIAYLLKPFDEQAFTKALTKYETLRGTFRTGNVPNQPLTPDVIAQLRQALQPTQQAYKQRFTVRMRNGLYLLPVEQITYLQADDSLVFAYDAAGQRYPLTGTLTELESQLDPARFFRLNRSEIVALAAIDRLETYGNDRLAVQVRGAAAPLISSTAKTPELRRWLG